MNQKLDYIDSLRGIAILMVVMTHTAQSVPQLPEWILTLTKYGQLGVQLFFIVSAITLGLSADRRSDEESKIRKYFIRRFFRIAPLYYTGILWYFLFRSMQDSLASGTLQASGIYTPINVLTNVFFVHGFYPPSHNFIVPGGWSIGTEMAFYLCFPALFLLFMKMSKRGTFQYLGLFILTVSSYYFLENWFVSWAWTPVEKNNFIYYNLLNQLPVFMLGLFVYFLAKDHSFSKIPIIVNLLFLGLSSWFTIKLWHAEWTFLSPFMFVPFTAGLAFVFLYNIFSNVKALNPFILQKIGQVSFSMYVLHFVFAWYGVKYLNRQLGEIGRPIILFGVYYIITVVLTFVLAVISEKYIEKPGILMGKRLAQKLNGHSRPVS